MFHLIRRSFGRGMTFGLIALTSSAFTMASTDVSAESMTSANTTGTGSYVCTPAGFGRKSQCYLR